MTSDGSAAAVASGARRVLRMAVQLGGFALGVGLLVWCVRQALSPENRAQLEHLRDAPRGLLAAAIALTVLSIVLNGLVFWAVLYPVRRLRPADVVAVNALATFLNYLPFKISVISRVLIHRGRDGVPVFVIGGWFTAMGAVLLAAVGPVSLATVVTRRLDGLWFVLAGAGLVVAVAAMVGLARVFGGPRGMERLTAIVDAVRLRPLSLLIRAGFVKDLHAGMTMLASPAPVVVSVVLRLTDMLVQGARFVILAAILGRDLGFDEAFLFSVTYFTIGVLSPVGMLGFREMGTAAVAGFIGVADPGAFVVVPLLVGATEAVVNLGAAIVGIAWLRPLRWLLGRRAAERVTSPA